MATKRSSTSTTKVTPRKIAETSKGQSITPIIGAPMGMSYTESQNMVKNSSLILTIIPCTASMAKGTTLFTLTSAIEDYKKRLKTYGYEIGSSSGVKVCVQGDFAPSESFSNEYGDSFLSKLANVASEGISDINQITGSTRGTEAAGKLVGAASDWAGPGIIGSALEEIKQKADSLDKWATSNQKKAGGAVGIANAILGGARIDFPQVWKNSSYTPNYSVNIKLYNPNPGSDKAIEYFLIGPLTALLLLGLPSTQSNTDMRAYNYPYFHKITSNGLFEIEQGAISSISVTKGIDGQIGYNQRLGMIEVRVDFVDLHAHMIGSTDSNSPLPTLMKYIKNLRTGENVYSIYDKSDSTTSDSKSSEYYDAKIPAAQVDTTTDASERINEDSKEEADALETANPKDLSATPITTNSSLTPVAPPTATQWPTTVQTAQAEKAQDAKDRGLSLNATIVSNRATQVSKARWGQ